MTNRARSKFGETNTKNLIQTTRITLKAENNKKKIHP